MADKQLSVSSDCRGVGDEWKGLVPSLINRMTQRLNGRAFLPAPQNGDSFVQDGMRVTYVKFTYERMSKMQYGPLPTSCDAGDEWTAVRVDVLVVPEMEVRYQREKEN